LKVAVPFRARQEALGSPPDTIWLAELAGSVNQPSLIHPRKTARQDAGQKWQFTSEQFMLMNDQRLQLCHA
jgi:GH25 family lysozyme M1 (1,4-beta-N-acetylmuramidase)